jgi:hypothetical protein
MKIFVLVFVLASFSVTSCSTFKKQMEKSIGPVLSSIRNTSYNSYLRQKYSYMDQPTNEQKRHLTPAQKKKLKLKAAINNSAVGQFIRPPSVQGHIDYIHDKRFNETEQDILSEEQERYERQAKLKFKKNHEILYNDY